MEEISLIHENAIRRFTSGLSEKDRDSFKLTTVNDVLADLVCLERKQATFSRTRRVSRRIEPVIKFLQRYALAVDSLIQFNPQPSALAWGCLRFLIEFAGSFAKYFSKIVEMMEQIGDILPVWERYEQMFADSKPFREALANMYFDIIFFLCQARKTFSSNALKTLSKVIWKPFEIEFEDVLKDLARHTKILQTETTLAHRQTIHVERRRRVMEWLDPVDVESDLHRESKKRAADTCDWILRDPLFEIWRDPNNPTKQGLILWINGPPGSGKTIITSKITEDLRQEGASNQNIKVVYFFFNKNDDRKHTSGSLVASMIAQLVADLQTMPSDLLDAYQTATRFGRSRISASDGPTRILSSLVSQIPMLYLILDGLDESSDWKEIFELQLDLMQRFSSVRILGVSRDVEPQRNDLATYPTIKVDAGRTKSDIDVFLKEEIAEVSKSLGEEHLNQLLFERLSRDANGIFLWAHLMVHTVKSASSMYEIKTVTEKVPRGLAELYASILSELDKESETTQILARRVFMWICCSSRPLSWLELQSALGVDLSDTDFDYTKKPFKNVIIRLCSPLIEYQSDEETFHPIHSSVSEFLVQAASTEFTSNVIQRFCTPKNEAHAFITAISLAYLSFPAIADSILFSQDEYPFAAYATSNLCYHLIQSEPGPVVQQRLKDFLASSSRRRTWQTRWLLMDMGSYPLQRLVAAQFSIQRWITAANYGSSFEFDALGDMFGVLLDLDSQEKILGISNIGFQVNVGHSEKMMVVRDLARLYTGTGRLDDAEKWLISALAEQEQRFGKDAVESVWILNSLGVIYDQQAKFQLSAETQLRALEIQKERLSPGHLDAVWTSNELGRVYRHLSELDQAVLMHQQALSILEPILPSNDAHIVWTLNCLARTYRHQNKLDEALELHTRAFESQKQSLGIDHPHTLWTMTDIGRCLRDQGRYLEAYHQMLAALEGRQKVLGLNHADTCWSVNYVRVLFESIGKEERSKIAL